jgi:DNA-binding transcriptional LysR family regulator
VSTLTDVEKALDGLWQGFQADGADLAIVSATESKVTIRLIGTDETCWICIVSPDQLRTGYRLGAAPQLRRTRDDRPHRPARRELVTSSLGD